jgi:hypothetical protein
VRGVSRVYQELETQWRGRREDGLMGGGKRGGADLVIEGSELRKE